MHVKHCHSLAEAEKYVLLSCCSASKSGGGPLRHYTGVTGLPEGVSADEENTFEFADATSVAGSSEFAPSETSDSVGASWHHIGTDPSDGESDADP